MSRQTYKRVDGDAVYHALQQRKRDRREEYRVLDPGPNDLTAEKIAERMSRIFVGDKITFDSIKECFTASQVDRHGSTIKASGRVVEHCGGYVMVQLKHGLLESVNYFGIESVNNKKWPWYIDPGTTIDSILTEEVELWR